MATTSLAQLEALLETPELASLGAKPRANGQSVEDVNGALDKIFASSRRSEESADLIRSLILLWHDHLDESHALSQQFPTPDGSYVHGIMHRREFDFDNARYWFNRTGRHDAFPTVAKAVATLPATDAERIIVDRCVRNGSWDPYAFIDCCQEELQSPSTRGAFMQRIQKAEFSVLLNYLALL
jgi:hypothetical protein